MVSVAAILMDAGVRVIGGSPKRIEYLHDGHSVTAHIARYDALPRAIRRDAGPDERLLVVCASASDRARTAALARPHTDLVIAEPREVVLSGHTYQRAERPSAIRPSTAYGRAAVERVVALSTQPMRQADIAAAAGVTQQAVSKILARNGLTGDHLTAPERERVLDGWMEQYRPTVEQTYWYGLESPADQVRAVVDYARELTAHTQIGGEVAADLTRPWRVPTRGLVYADELIDLMPIGLVAAGADDATLVLQVSEDRTVARTARWWTNHAGPFGELGDVVDPVIALWDLSTGRDPGDGAVDELFAWIVTHGGGDPS
ncbi:hypothetical protein [Gordonia rhizosphera]|uniref:Uncharacterized protein n=1 Tax=Gordonia rhizosphera NBRC 16068 TaxID=1108045 RepID=K6VVT0_9ACTN|nr:hypothetical protein [Gordonia rhizosphera]GAB91010.1 hypothetical protein GORHZ_121_00020 [Gordonia rhizosphera NBRC 16068]